MHLTVWGQTDVGLKREINQDSILVDKKLALFVVADGRLLYIGDTASRRKEGGKLMYLEAEYLESLGVPPMSI